ncbi:MAG TPA: c-type cytochrome [Bryobacteraceae bacterium]|jgi:putative heme-binding domain-containing protein|nr:c-type cytochrome [Bryobacteraceae bacterium]
MRVTMIALLAAACCHAQDAAEKGRWTFRIFCAPCHGIHADGGRGPDLTLGTYSAGDQDADIFRVISRGVAGTEMAAYSGRMSDDEIRGLVAYIRSVSHASDKSAIRGDAGAGEAIFWTKGGCGQCHRVGTRGSSLGPDLTRVGRQRSLAYLTASLLTPDADVTPGYATVTVVTRDGKKIVGVERNFDNFSAQLVDLSGKYYSFEREDVQSMKREPRSLMPSTYGQLLSESERNDLLAYLSSLRGGR